MAILLVIAFISGLITILAPCIWPLLPIVLSSTATGGKPKALGITLGIVTAFAIFTLTISYLVSMLNFNPDAFRLFAIIVIGFLGTTLLIPSISKYPEAVVSRLSSKFANLTTKKSKTFVNGLITGAALGIVWTPCTGPILATIATLAATRTVNFQLVLVTFVYSIGVAIPLFLFAYGGNLVFTKSRIFNRYTGRIQQIFGALMILMAVAIYTNYDKVLQAKLLDLIPSYSNFLNKLENSRGVQEQLDKIKYQSKSENQTASRSTKLEIIGPAPELVGITGWLNLPPETSLSLSELRGNVVLIDFWTYTCINCIRTLPYITSWYEKYKDQGFVVLGIHTPEFEFEKKTANVQKAIELYKITYPVAQDNNFQTWDAFNNRYWPAKYLIDKDGNIRYAHFGEGKYEETERNIQALLAETGSTASNSFVKLENQTPRGSQTPELYLGKARMQFFVSNEQVSGGLQTFTPVESIPPDHFSYDGTWTIENERAITTTNAALNLNFYASKVFLVITPRSASDSVKVFLDGHEIDPELSGTDVINGQIKLDSDRLYEIVDLKGENSNHILRLQFNNAGISVFAFTFG